MMVATNHQGAEMKDERDRATPDLLESKTKAQRFREKQLEAGLRQFSFWLKEDEAAKVKKLIVKMRGK